MNKIFLGLFIFIEMISCQSSEIENEIQSINEIFIELTDSMYIYKIYPPPPPPPLSLNERNNIMNFDSVKYQFLLDKYKEQLQKIKNNTQKIVLAVNDSLFFFNINDFDYIENELPSPEYLNVLNSFKNNPKKNVPINLDEIINTGKYRLKYLSEFPKGFNIWKKEYDFIFGGVIHISRIYFNKNKNIGIFYYSFSCGGECGHGDIVCIRKDNDKWVIDKIIRLWIS